MQLPPGAVHRPQLALQQTWPAGHVVLPHALTPPVPPAPLAPPAPPDAPPAPVPASPVVPPSPEAPEAPPTPPGAFPPLLHPIATTSRDNEIKRCMSGRYTCRRGPPPRS